MNGNQRVWVRYLVSFSETNRPVRPVMKVDTLGKGTTVPGVRAAGFLHMTHTSSHGKTFVVGHYMTRERVL
jgi:hypothetical protein